MIRLFDRLLCLLWTGHVWLPVGTHDARSCVHCGKTMSAIEVIAFWRRHFSIPVGHGKRYYPDIPASVILRELHWPKRVW